MNCDTVTKLIPLYFYGEVTPDEEDQVDQHLSECPACAALMEQQRAMAAAFDERKLEVPAALLEECRDDLMAAIAGGAPRQVKPAKGPWGLFLDAMTATFRGFGGLRQLVTALLLILVGFMVARFTGAGPSTVPLTADNTYPTVREVKADSNGGVLIDVDETSRREVRGTLSDPKVQRLLLAALRDQNNAALRLQSAGLLTHQADSPPVLDSFLNLLTSDPNDGVRLEALRGVKPMASDPRVLKTLSQVLLTDPNPAMRMQVIDMMVSRRDDTTVGLLQNLIQREDNSGVRTKAFKALKDWNASIGSF